ncbi:MAG: transglutaminase-like domain-containing protein [Mucinivorans sp.]
MMKKSIIWTMNILLFIVLASCHKPIETTTDPVEPDPKEDEKEVVDTKYFPPEGDAQILTGSEANQFKLVIEKSDPKNSLELIPTPIADNEYQVIKTFTDALVAGMNQRDKYNTIFRWITKNISYGRNPDHGNDPFVVFNARIAVCEGYANLFKVMLLTQSIPTIVVYGMYSTLGGHAWNYSFVDGAWIVGDPTNNTNNAIGDLAGYSSRLIPYRADTKFFVDNNFVYGYDKGLSVNQIKATTPIVAIPFAINGYQISVLSLKSLIPPTVKDLYIGSNIHDLGELGVDPSRYAPNLENIFFAQSNTHFHTYKGVVYLQGKKTPFYVPSGKGEVWFLSTDKVVKNTLYNHQRATIVHFGVNTKTIDNYAIESCPALQKIYVPASIEKIAEKAFSDVGTAQVIRY